MYCKAEVPFSIPQKTVPGCIPGGHLNYPELVGYLPGTWIITWKICSFCASCLSMSELQVQSLNPHESTITWAGLHRTPANRCTHGDSKWLHGWFSAGRLASVAHLFRVVGTTWRVYFLCLALADDKTWMHDTCFLYIYIEMKYRNVNDSGLWPRPLWASDPTVQDGQKNRRVSGWHCISHHEYLHMSRIIWII